MSDEKKEFENFGEENIVENDSENEASQKDIVQPSLGSISENPEEIQTRVKETLEEAEKSIAEELGENSIAPVEVQEEAVSVEDNILIRKIKRQNTLLKIICACLIGCTIVNVFMAGPNKNKSNIYVSDSEINEIVFKPINRAETMSAAQIYNKNINSVVAIHVDILTPSVYGDYVAAGSGSGFIISEDGYVLTNHHVVENATNISVVLANGKEHKAKLIGSEADSDVAVIKLETEDKFAPVVLGKSENVIIGEDVVTIGNPLGELTFSITKGIVSGVDRNIQIDNYTSVEMFQVDCALNQGTSGGPILNMYGEVIGMVSAKYASDTIEGLGFAIPVDDITSILPDLIMYGKVMNKSYLGVAVLDVSEEMVHSYNMVPGAYISSIDEGSCAQKAGLKIGDIIVKIGAKDVNSVSGLFSAKKHYKAGETTTIKVWRGGEYVEMSVTFDKYVEAENVQVSESIIEQTPQNIYPQNPNGQYSIEDFLWDYIYNNR